MLGLKNKSLLALLSVVVFGLVFFTPLTLPLQQSVYDLKMQLRAAVYELETPIVIVAIDDDSLQKLGHWPWPRSRLAHLLSVLENHYKVNHVGLNVLMPEPSEADEDVALAGEFNALRVTSAIAFDLEREVFSGQRPVGLKVPVVGGENTTPAVGWVGVFALLSEAPGLFGHVNTLLASDGKTRQLPLFIELEGEAYPQFSVAMLYNLLGGKAGFEIWAETLSPVDDLKQVFIPFDFNSLQVPMVSASAVFEQTAPKALLENALILIGSTSVGMGDFVSTPIDNKLPSVFLQAYILNAAMSHKWIKEPSRAIELAGLAVVVWTLFVLLLAHVVSTRALLQVLLVGTIGIVAWNVYQFVALGREWDLVVWLLLLLTHSVAILFIKYRFNTAKSKQIEALFKSYVPDNVLQTLIQDNYQGLDRGERRRITVLFVDLVDFSALAEHCEPELLTAKIRAVFNALTPIILKNNGTVDKYMGDSIMAFWGAPLDDEQQAYNAVTAALQMREAIGQHFLDINIGIGINTGVAVVGNIGSDFRHAYSALGDTVNVASRVERYTRVVHKTILLTQSTALACGYQTQWVADISIRGRVQCEPIYTL